MGISNIFDLFKQEDKPTETSPSTIIDEYIFNINMFSKFIIRGNVRKDLLIDLVKELKPECDKENVRAEGEDILYNRAFLYIQYFDKKDPIWLEALDICSDVFLVTSLQMCRKYFEDREEYEKCAILQFIFERSSKIVAINKEKA